MNHLFTFLLLLPFSLIYSQNKPIQSSPSKPYVEGLSAYISKLNNSAAIPGTSIAVIQENKLIFSEAIGVKSTDTKESVDQFSLFSAASLSKPLFAHAVLKLAETDQFDIDKPLYEYLEYPDIAKDERYKKITARMVLSHSSGLPNWRRGELKLSFDPGERFQYSGEGFVYLMKVIEKISGKAINDWMQEMAFDPLNMKSSSYVWKEEFESNFAMPHNDFSRTFSKYKPKEGNTAHSLQTTAEDYAQFLITLFQLDTINAQMLSPQVEVAQEKSGSVHWGIGIGLQKVEERTAFWHWGDNGTYKCFMIGFPKERTGLVYFTNSSNGLGIASELLQRTFGTSFPAIEWINYTKYDSPERKLVKAALDGHFDPMLQQYMHRDGKHQDTLLIKEQGMNRLGYSLMNLKLMAPAKKVFQLNMEAYPGSSNVYDSYAEACLRNGEHALAAKYYQKTAELDPDNQIAKTIVQRLDRANHKGNTSFRLEGYANAKHVSLAGSFNDWNNLSHPFIWENGAWLCTLDLKPGEYNYKFIVDGIWIPDPSNKAINVEDNLNSILIVK